MAVVEKDKVADIKENFKINKYIALLCTQNDTRVAEKFSAPPRKNIKINSNLWLVKQAENLLSF